MSIDGARELIHDEEVRAVERWRRRQEHESLLQSLQELVEDVEVRNLSSDREVREDLWRRVERLVERAPVEPPRDLWRVRLTPRLHDALLRWQGALLDHVAPHRRQFADRYD